MPLYMYVFIVVLVLYFKTGKISQTEPDPFEGTWWSAYRVKNDFRSSLVKDQSPGKQE